MEVDVVCQGVRKAANGHLVKFVAEHPKSSPETLIKQEARSNSVVSNT